MGVVLLVSRHRFYTRKESKGNDLISLTFANRPIVRGPLKNTGWRKKIFTIATRHKDKETVRET